MRIVSSIPEFPLLSLAIYTCSIFSGHGSACALYQTQDPGRFLCQKRRNHILIPATIELNLASRSRKGANTASVRTSNSIADLLFLHRPVFCWFSNATAASYAPQSNQQPVSVSILRFVHNFVRYYLSLHHYPCIQSGIAVPYVGPRRSLSIPMESQPPYRQINLSLVDIPTNASTFSLNCFVLSQDYI